MEKFSHSINQIEKETIELGRLLSLQSLRDKSNYSFDQLSIPVECQPNSGLFAKFSRTCCFISISDGLRHNGVRNLEIGSRTVPLDPSEIRKLAKFPDQSIMLDTDNKFHQECLDRLAKCFPQIKLQFYMGVNIGGQWYTTPDPVVVFGNGDCIIRILNQPNPSRKNGFHFEFIITKDEAFVGNIPIIHVETILHLQNEREYYVKK